MRSRKTWGNMAKPWKRCKWPFALQVIASLSVPLFLTAQQAREWEVFTPSGVERRTYPQPEIVHVGLPEAAEVPSAVIGTGQGRRLPEVEVVVREGEGGEVTAGPAGDQVLALAEDAGGNVWVGTGDGLSRFNGQMWTTFTQGDGLGANLAGHLLVDGRGDLWVGTPGAITRFDGRRWTQYKVAGLSGGASIALAPNGDLWFAGGARRNPGRGVEGLAYRYDGQDWWEYSTDDGIPFPGPTMFVNVDHAGVVWIAVWGTDQPPRLPYELASFDGRQWVGYDLPFWDPYGSVGTYSPVRTLYSDASGQLWVGCGWSVLVFDGETWRRYTGRRWGEPQAVTGTGGSGVWISTGEGGFGLLRGGTWALISREVSRLAPLALLLDHRGDLWMGSAGPEGRMSPVVRWPAPSLPTSIVMPPSSSTPSFFRLLPNHPNPFNSETLIPFDISEPQAISLRIMSPTGQAVATLAEGRYLRGQHEVQWDGRDQKGWSVASGSYLCQLRGEYALTTRKLTIVR